MSDSKGVLKVSPHKFLKSIAPEIQRVLPHGLDADRIVRIAYTEVQKNPKLAECSERSFAGALLTAGAIGLEIGQGLGGESYLAPYKGEVSLIVGYKGYVKLFWQHPFARGIEAHVVYEGDDFDYEYGTNEFIRHKPTRDRAERGNVIGYWAQVRLANGSAPWVFLDTEEVKELRGGKIGSNGGIRDPQRWMEKKVAIAQLLKLMPKSTAMARALNADEVDGSDLYANLPKMAASGEDLEEPPVDAETVDPDPVREVEAPAPVRVRLEAGADERDASEEIMAHMNGRGSR